ncbi:MAG: patatin-like phospholipase family protein, partial [Bacteroidetes bacterium]
MIRRLPTLITGLLLLSGCTYNMYPNQEMLMRHGPPAADLSAYRSVQERPGQDPELALTMALSGGGARAYHFAMGVMLGLEEMGLAPGRNVLREVDYFSTVSGGGFAAGAWIAELKRDSAASLAKAWDAHIAEAFSRSYGIPIARGYVSPKVFLTRLNAGDPLEKVIDKRVLGGNRRHTVLLGDMYLPAADSLGRVRLPMIASNSTVYYNMAILPFTPNVLSEYQVCGYTHRMRLYRKRTPIDPYKMPLSVGLRASGSFPIFVPPA